MPGPELTRNAPRRRSNSASRFRAFRTTNLERSRSLRVAATTHILIHTPQRRARLVSSRSATQCFSAADHVHGLPKWTQDARHRRVPAVAQLQRAKLQDLVSALMLPTCAAALHANAHERFAGRFDSAAADRLPCDRDAACAPGEGCVLDHCLPQSNVTCASRRDCPGGQLCF